MKLITLIFWLARQFGPKLLRLNYQTRRVVRLFSDPVLHRSCSMLASHQAQPSKSGPKRFFYPTQPYNKRISPVKACLVFFAALVLILMIASPSGPISVLEGIFQLVVWGPFSLCESGWTCNAPGDITWFGVVK